MPGQKWSRSRSVCAIACLLSLFSLTAEAQIRFDLPAQSLAQALTTVGSLANLNIYFDASTVDGIRAPALKAQLSADDALSKLLTGTRLHAVRVDDNTFRVVADLDSKHAQNVHDPATGAVTRATGVHFASAAGAVGTSDSASASADESLEAGGIQEVIVTAQKREERLLDVPISMVAIGTDELAKRKITDVDDLALAVPGLAISSNGAQRQIEIRGVSNAGGGNLPLIGLYLDEADVTSGPFSQLDLGTYDLARVEVLRGPQGTLYGEGSAGGTIRFITRNPQLDRFTFDADSTAMFTQAGAPSQRIEEALNIPVIENQLAFRISGAYDHEGGWIDQPATDRKDWNDQNRVDVRFKGLWQPTPELAANAMAVIHRNRLGINEGEDAQGNFTQIFNLTTTPQERDDYNIYNLVLTYDFPRFRVLSTTSYLEQNQKQENFEAVAPFGPPGTPLFDELQTPVAIRAYVATEELRLTSSGTGPWQWTLGGFYRHYRYDLNNTFYFGLPGPSGTPLPPPSFLAYSTLSESHAAFADTNYRLFGRLTLGAGLRYFSDDQQYTNGPTQSGSFHSVDPRFYAQYKVTDTLNTYASAAKGFRSGGFNALSQPVYEPEEVWTYELGTKASLLDGHLNTDLAVFYSDYTNYQIQGTLPPPAAQESIYSNAGSAWIRGIEWDFAWRSIDRWTFSVNGDYMGTRFYKINATSTAYIAGDPIDYVPKYTYTVSAERAFTFNGRPGFARLDYNQQGRETNRNRSLGPSWFGESDVINMLNFNTGIQYDSHLSLGLFAQNLLNDRGFTSPVAFLDEASRARPRTYGIHFNVNFD